MPRAHKKKAVVEDSKDLAEEEFVITKEAPSKIGKGVKTSKKSKPIDDSDEEEEGLEKEKEKEVKITAGIATLAVADVEAEVTPAPAPSRFYTAAAQPVVQA